MTTPVVTGWADRVQQAAAEVEREVTTLRELAAEAAMAQEVAQRKEDLGLARACEQRAEDLGLAVAALRRQGERLRAWHDRAVAEEAERGAPGGGPTGWRSGLIEAQEEERRRLARDIHDGPAQLLANVVFRIDVAQTLLGEDRDRARGELEQLKALVRHSLQDVRKIIFDLRPLALDDLGLIPALRSYVAGLPDKFGLTVGLAVEGVERRLPTAYEVALFRLVQEALHNVRKHAGTDAAEVAVCFSETAIEVRIADHGQGFDPAAHRQASGNHLGLRSMRERAELFGGDLHLESLPGEGTRITVTVPLPEERGLGRPPG